MHLWGHGVYVAWMLTWFGVGFNVLLWIEVAWKEWRLCHVFAYQTGRTTPSVNENEVFARGLILETKYCLNNLSEGVTSHWNGLGLSLGNPTAENPETLELFHSFSSSLLNICMWECMRHQFLAICFSFCKNSGKAEVLFETRTTAYHLNPALTKKISLSLWLVLYDSAWLPFS